MEDHAPKKVRPGWKIPFLALKWVLFIFTVFLVWAFRLPKDPFDLLSADRVEKIEYITGYAMEDGTTVGLNFVTLDETAQKAMIEDLRKLTIARRMTGADLFFIGGVAPGDGYPSTGFLITLKNSFRFYLQIHMRDRAYYLLLAPYDENESKPGRKIIYRTSFDLGPRKAASDLNYFGRFCSSVYRYENMDTAELYAEKISHYLEADGSAD